MYIFLYASSKPANLPQHEFLGVDLQGQYNHVPGKNYLYRKDKEEFYADHISGLLDDDRYKDINAIIINKDLGGNGWARAVRLAGHIATTLYSHCQLHKLPIVLTDRSLLDIRDSSIGETAISHPFREGAFYFFTHDELFTPVLDEAEGIYINLIEKKHLDPVDLDSLQVKGSNDKRHQSTNEWGPMRLAYNFGLQGEITFNYPHHLYFKYLALSMRQRSTPRDTTLNGLFTRILLIDDQADSGWSELIGKIFSAMVDPLSPDKKDDHWKTLNYAQYDLVLLDLYLEGKPDKALSLDVLQYVKGKFPQIPVVIFTASEKAWNMHEVFEKGADAMYIKESPEYVNDSNYSLQNYQYFKKTILDVSDKYKTLRPYWDVIEQILTHPNFKKIENNPRRIKDRLEERFKMFYGLLKKGYEQHQYDKNTFFYSDYELSFMTLWSMLNEIQAYRFEKRTHKDAVAWKLLSDPLFYIQYQPRVRRTPATFRTDLASLPPWYKPHSANAYSKLIRFEQQIALQIRYILQRMNPAAPAHYAIRLEKLNRIRNSLYLTHGQDTSAYFSATEEMKRKKMTTMTPQGSIKDLFNLIAYITTEVATVKII